MFFLRIYLPLPRAKLTYFVYSILFSKLRYYDIVLCLNPPCWRSEIQGALSESGHTPLAHDHFSSLPLAKVIREDRSITQRWLGRSFASELSLKLWDRVRKGNSSSCLIIMQVNCYFLLSDFANFGVLDVLPVDCCV